MKKYLFLIISTLTLFSCATRKEIVYFQDAESLEGMQNLLNYEPVIQPNDVLRIQVSSRNEEVVAPFQMNTGGQQSGGGGQNMSLTGYLVDPEGFIQFPVLGRIEVAGEKRTALEQDLQTRLRSYVTDAVVSIRIANFSITVLGEVGHPGRVKVQDGRITVPELLAESGDVAYTGKRRNILVIREEDGVKKVGRVDMTDTDLFSNPFYYLKQNDIVYVEPTYKKVKSAGFFTSYTGIISLGTTIISLYLLINSL